MAFRRVLHSGMFFLLICSVFTLTYQPIVAQTTEVTPEATAGEVIATIPVGAIPMGRFVLIGLCPFWGQVCLGLAVTSFIGALDAGWSSRSARVLAAVGVIASTLSILLVRRGNLRAVSPNKPLPSTSGPGRAGPTRDDR